MGLKDYREKIERIDKEMASLFEERMRVAADIAAYKKENDMPIEDKVREREVFAEGLDNISNEDIKPYYGRLIKNIIELSKSFQRSKLSSAENLDGVIIGQDLLHDAYKYFDLNRKVMIITDDGVPFSYAKTVADQANAFIHVIRQGEESKRLSVAEEILADMQKNDFSREDCIVAVGGGVVGDVAGLCANLYMRGIDFYNVPTTVLSMCDSSVGGKTGVNLGGIKNTVGTFYQPKCVLIDTDTLKTLDKRQYNAGLVEAIKTGMIADEKLFAMFKEGIGEGDIEEVIRRSLAVKKKIVEADERESDIRRALNFGHTIGHGIESVAGLLHGESVALGMIPMCEGEAREGLLHALEMLGLKTKIKCDAKAVYEATLHDKKTTGDKIATVRVNSVGSYEIINTDKELLKDMISMVVEE